METIIKTKQVKITKKQILINLMSKPMGVKLTTLVDNLGWQKHTTLGFISNLRKKGYDIQSIKGSKGTLYKLEKPELIKQLEADNETTVASEV